MEEARALAQQQQQLLLQHQQQQAHNQQQQQQQKQNHHQNQQQFLLLQQLQQQQAAISRFPSNIDAHLRPPGLHRPITLPQQNPNASPNSNPNPSPNPISNSQQHTQINLQQIQQQQQQQSQQQQQQSQQQQQQQQSQQQQQQQQQQRNIRPLNQVELQMAYQDAWRVCHPDFKRPFTSFEDACERLLPYHVVADYEAEEDDRILDSDTTGQMLSRSQQWDHNIAAKVAEFTGTFEKQALAFNIITRKRAIGEFRSEERLMIEQALLQEEKRAMMELRAELESRERAGREAHEARMRMAAMAQAEQARDEMMARAPIRANALGGSQVNNVSIGRPDIEQEQGGNTDEMMNGWGNNAQRDEKEPSEDFLNDEEAENGDTGMQQEEWREVGEFDLNSR